MRCSLLATAASAGCFLAVAGLQIGTATAGASDAKHLRETDCRDVVDGAARYERDRVVDDLPVSDSEYPDELKKDSGRLTAALRLSAPSCSTVDYLMHAFRPDGTLLLSRVVSGAAGREQVDFSVAIEDYADNCMAVQFVTRVGSVVVDLAPDALTTHDTVCDGFTADLVYK